MAMVAVSPAVRAAAGEREALRKAVDQLLAQPPLAGARVSVEVDALEDGQPVVSRNADDLLNPASNTKLITSAAALLRLGPEYRFTTDYLGERAIQRGRVGNLYVKGRGDPSVNTERVDALAADLWHRGLRSVRDIVLDDSFFDREQFGPGWEQETSDKAWAAGVGALSLNHNTVAVYLTPADRAGSRARVEVEPDTRDYFIIENRVTTVRQNGRRKLRPHALIEGERTRIVVEGRIPKGAEPVVLFRRVGDPTFYYGQTLRLMLKKRGIRVSGRVKRGAAPESAVLLQSYESPSLAEIVRDMNKVSSNFIAEMLVKTLGAELKGSPGSWAKGLEVAEDLLGELGLPRGTYVLKNGSGLNDTNRFSARQMATLLGAMWKRFPVAAEFVASLGIAARDGTMRLRMEGTDAAGRLRAKTGTLEHVTALSGYVQSLGGERFVFSVLVNDWSGRSAPIISSIDRLGVMLAAIGAPEAGAREAALASLQQLAPQEAQPAELKARIATYAALASAHDKKNLPFLRSALRTERDPLLRVVLADAVYRSDPDQGGGALLEAMPASPDLFLRLRSVGRELALPVPAVSSLLDLAVDGNSEALARLLALAPLARGPQHDEQLEALMSDGLVEVGEASPDELLAALRAAPAAQAQAAVELMAIGLAQAGSEVGRYPLSRALRLAAGDSGAQLPQMEGWLAVLEHREWPEAKESAPAASSIPAPPPAAISPAPAPAAMSSVAPPAATVTAAVVPAASPGVVSTPSGPLTPAAAPAAAPAIAPAAPPASPENPAAPNTVPSAVRPAPAPAGSAATRVGPSVLAPPAPAPDWGKSAVPAKSCGPDPAACRPAAEASRPGGG
jgi:D-alanyl-D-alanine carboxypeptidase/D-alanyl-D-alanine-endopeptidase (penicillin-binding protein 4)